MADMDGFVFRQEYVTDRSYKLVLEADGREVAESLCTPTGCACCSDDLLWAYALECRPWSEAAAAALLNRLAEDARQGGAVLVVTAYDMDEELQELLRRRGFRCLSGGSAPPGLSAPLLFGPKDGRRHAPLGANQGEPNG